MAIVCALQARTWAEPFYDPPHAVVEDSGGYRGTLGGRAETLSRQETHNGDAFGDLAVGGPVPPRIPHRTLRTS